MEHGEYSKIGQPKEVSSGVAPLDLLAQAKTGDSQALSALFAMFETRLGRLIDSRLDGRLRARIDTADVIQEAFIEFAKGLADYEPRPDLSFYVWLRMLTLRKLSAMQRAHLGTDARDVRREVTRQGFAYPTAESGSLANLFVGKLTSPSHAAVRDELRLRVQSLLDELEPNDREIIFMRHFEQLSNQEISAVLELTAAAASIRYIRAVRRLKPLLEEIIGRERADD